MNNTEDQQSTDVQQPITAQQSRNGMSNTVKGALYITLPMGTLFLIFVLQGIVRAFTEQGESTNPNPVETIINIFTLIAGVIALIMIPIGLIRGITLFTKKS